MYKVEGTKISLTRGDTFYCDISMTRNGEPYVPVEGDSLRFVLKHADMINNNSAYKDDEPLLDIDIPIDTCRLKIASEDTSELTFGKYVYDIEITFANGDVDTFINNASFIILPEVG